MLLSHTGPGQPTQRSTVRCSVVKSSRVLEEGTRRSAAGVRIRGVRGISVASQCGSTLDRSQTEQRHLAPCQRWVCDSFVAGNEALQYWRWPFRLDVA